MFEQLYNHFVKACEGQTDRQTDRRADRQTERQGPDRQKERNLLCGPCVSVWTLSRPYLVYMDHFCLGHIFLALYSLYDFLKGPIYAQKLIVVNFFNFFENFKH